MKAAGEVMMQGETILIVEDELEIGELVRDYLRVEGFQVVLASDGEAGIRQFREANPCLAVLDIMLPKLDGTEVCRIIRAESNIPIIMMSAKKSDTDKIIHLGVGADDYVTKPFSPGELVARIKAQLRRSKHLSTPKQQAVSQRLVWHHLELDPQSYAVYVNSRQVECSAKEFQLLHFLMAHPNQVFSKEQLFDHVWGYDRYGDMNTVTVYIRKIREKIEHDPSHPELIKTVWGVGYKLDGGSA